MTTKFTQSVNVVHHHADGDNWSANNVFLDGFGHAIGYMASSEECQSLIDSVKIKT